MLWVSLGFLLISGSVLWAIDVEAHAALITKLITLLIALLVTLLITHYRMTNILIGTNVYVGRSQAVATKQ